MVLSSSWLLLYSHPPPRLTLQWKRLPLSAPFLPGMGLHGPSTHVSSNLTVDTSGYLMIIICILELKESKFRETEYSTWLLKGRIFNYICLVKWQVDHFPRPQSRWVAKPSSAPWALSPMVAPHLAWEPAMPPPPNCCSRWPSSVLPSTLHTGPPSQLPSASSDLNSFRFGTLPLSSDFWLSLWFF